MRAAPGQHLRKEIRPAVVERSRNLAASLAAIGTVAAPFSYGHIPGRTSTDTVTCDNRRRSKGGPTTFCLARRRISAFPAFRPIDQETFYWFTCTTKADVLFWLADSGARRTGFRGE